MAFLEVQCCPTATGPHDIRQKDGQDHSLGCGGYIGKTIPWFTGEDLKALLFSSEPVRASPQHSTVLSTSSKHKQARLVTTQGKDAREQAPAQS